MHCYIIVFEDDDPHSEFESLAPVQEARVKSAFRDRHHKFAKHAWVVGSPASMPHEICEMVGLHPSIKYGPDGMESDVILSGVVCRMDEYNGMTDRTLWEKVRLWSTS